LKLTTGTGTDKHEATHSLSVTAV